MLITSLADNSLYFRALKHLWRCLLWLSKQRVRVVRAQIKEGRALVEVVGPLQTELPITESEHKGQPYLRVDVCGCQVIWRRTDADALFNPPPTRKPGISEGEHCEHK